MALIYLYAEVEAFPLEKLEEEAEDQTVEPSEPEDCLAEWRYIVDL